MLIVLVLQRGSFVYFVWSRHFECDTRAFFYNRVTLLSACELLLGGGIVVGIIHIFSFIFHVHFIVLS